MNTLSPEQASWLPFHSPRPAARVRLFCFPYAGGGATLYRTWQAALGDDVEVCAVQLPGRENRFRERPYQRMEPLLDDLLPALEPLLDRPYAFFGYSLGAAVAHEAALRLAGSRVPEHLFVCAQRAPHLALTDRLPADEMTDTQMYARIRALDGTPDGVLDNSELMAILGPLMRADLELNDSYVASPHRAHDCPVTAFGGRRDPEVSEDELDAWSVLTRGAFRTRMFDGGHFFIRDCAADLVAHVRAEVGATLARLPVR